jgi:hypothetical protein
MRLECGNGAITIESHADPAPIGRPRCVRNGVDGPHGYDHVVPERSDEPFTGLERRLATTLGLSQNGGYWPGWQPGLKNTCQRLRGQHNSDQRHREKGRYMNSSTRIIRAALLAAAAAALAAAAYMLREKHQEAVVAVQNIQDQLDALDPATRAAVIARLTSDEVKRVRSK